MSILVQELGQRVPGENEDGTSENSGIDGERPDSAEPTAADASLALVEGENKEGEGEEWATAEAPWGRIEGEPRIAYEQFLVYREMRGERSLWGMYRGVKGKPSAITLRKYYDKWDWKTRVLAWDRHVRTKRDIELVEVARSEGKRQVEIAASILTVAQRYFQELLRRSERGAFEKLDTATLLGTWPSATRALQTATQILRLIAREPTERLEVAGNVVGYGDMRVDLTRLNDGQIAEMLAALGQLPQSDDVPILEGHAEVIETNGGG
jgi:hypothetical protein